MKKIYLLSLILSVSLLTACGNKEVELTSQMENETVSVEDNTSLEALQIEQMLNDISAYTAGEIKENVVLTESEENIYIEQESELQNTNTTFVKSTSMKGYSKPVEKKVVKREASNVEALDITWNENDYVGYDDDSSYSSTPSYDEVIYSEPIVIEPEYVDPTPVVDNRTPEEVIRDLGLPTASNPYSYYGPIKVASYDGFNYDTSNVENLLSQVPQVLKDSYHKEYVYVLDDMRYVGGPGTAQGLCSAGVIYVEPNAELHTLIHEFGHSFTLRNGLDSVLESSYELYKDTFYTSSRNSSYGRDNVHEFCAEAIAEYFLKPSYLQTHYPDVYDILNSYLG